MTLDNLSGDESLSWMREAVPVAATAQLAGVARVRASHVESSREASILAPNTLIHGYFDRRRGALHFEFSIEDADTHKMRSLALDGDALHASAAIAKAMDAGAKEFSTQNAAAMEAWGRRDFEKATQLDPDFGAAWRDLIQSNVGQPEQAVQFASNALSKLGLRSPLEKAQIGLLAAQLRHDDAAVSQASLELVRLVPNDVELARKLAESESNARHFAPAVTLYQSVLRLAPDDFSVYNALGYAQFFAGNLAAARASFDEYAKHPGQDANGLDSQGEVLFMAGQFAEAEKYFQRAHQANPQMLDGADLQKAAYAHWLSGDLAGADKIFESYLQYRSQRADQTVNWRLAGWEYATGREVQAMERLASESGPAAGMAKAQLQVLKGRSTMFAGLAGEIGNLEQNYRRTPSASDGFARVVYAKALVMTGRKAEAEKLLVLWPLPESGEPAVQPLLYPLYLELKKELGK
ncbi:MAG: tetratricopeptide repeat protein [Bryobacteraceae bacterium]